jgi:formylglycine-generating enzyme required for sulfatase activity
MHWHAHSVSGTAAINHYHQKELMMSKSLFVPVPETKLPNGLTVPAFMVGQYLLGRGEDMAPAVTAESTPIVSVDFFHARELCDLAGAVMIREMQWLAIAHDIATQDINWTGGKVGAGKLFQGLRKGSVSAAQAGTYEPADPDERRWHQLSNGERVYDFAGNAYSWVFDDVQGDEQGLIARKFTAESASINTPAYSSETSGMGWYPAPGRDWSGYALLRGGSWFSYVYAGVFFLAFGWPGYGDRVVGVRCTK